MNLVRCPIIIIIIIIKSIIIILKLNNIKVIIIIIIIIIIQLIIIQLTKCVLKTIRLPSMPPMMTSNVSSPLRQCEISE